jgi:hypothetical protein
MVNIVDIAERIHDLSDGMSGVFSLADLRNLVGNESPGAFYRRVKRLEAAAVLTRFARGFYVCKDFDPLVLSQRIAPDSYVSFGTVLARELLIGSIPAQRVMAVKPGPARAYRGQGLFLEHLHIIDSMFFGYEVKEGIRLATPEKAVLDVLYFYKRGRKFSFDIYSDIDYSALDQARFDGFLGRYADSRFVEFCRRLVNA